MGLAISSTSKAFSNNLSEIQIQDLTHDGRGVGRDQGKACFVEGALPSERVSWSINKSHRQYDEGIVHQVLDASADRVEPQCQHFGQCGGCQLQHLDYSAQVQAKTKRLQSSLAHKNIHPTTWLSPITSDPMGYRRRARFSISAISKKHTDLQVGFKQRASAKVLPIDHCPVLTPELNKVLPELPRLISQLSGQFNGKQQQSLTEIEVNFDQNRTSITLLANSAKANLTEILPPESIQHCDIWYQAKPAEAKLLYSPSIENKTEIPTKPPGFLQANAPVNQKMVEQAGHLLALSQEDHLLDLFCGAGNFSLPYVDSVAAITGIELDDASVDQANKKAQNLDQVSFEKADLFDAKGLTALRSKFRKASVVILDPPRAGAEALVRELVKPKPARILYISCHPATFIRDAEILKRSGYQLDSVGLVDMFPQTMHAEVMGLFTI